MLELLLAVAVVGTLMTVAVSTYRSYVLQAQDARAAAQIEEIETRIAAYQTAHWALPTTLAQVGAGTVLDPWGHPYHYLDFTGLHGNGQVRKDHNLVPLNTDYDLFSAGPNSAWMPPITASVSQDDIIRADDGAYVGLASKY